MLVVNNVWRNNKMESIGLAFMGAGVLVFFSALSYLIYQICRETKSNSDVFERYCLFEISVLNQKANGHGINLEKEREKLRTLNYLPKKKTFQKMLHEEIIKEFFEKEEG